MILILNYNKDMPNDITSTTVTLSDLSPAHQMFVTKLLVTLNATRAYMAVYPEASYESAKAAASLLLTDINVQAVLSSELDKRAMQAQEIIDRMGNIARADMSEIIELVEEPAIDRHGEPIEHNGRIVMRQVPHIRAGALEAYGHLIKSITPANGGGVKVELYSAQDALVQMARIRRLIQDTPQVVNMEQVVIYMPDNGRDMPQVVDAMPGGTGSGARPISPGG
jgi:hypothetical protein